MTRSQPAARPRARRDAAHRGPAASQMARRRRAPDVASYYVWAGLVVGAVAYVPAQAARALGRRRTRASPVAGSRSCSCCCGPCSRASCTGTGSRTSPTAGSARTPQRRREIASDTHVGAFGATSIALVALVEYSALALARRSPRGRAARRPRARAAGRDRGCVAGHGGEADGPGRRGRAEARGCPAP